MYHQSEFISVNESLTIQEQINNIYQNLFSRDADATGLIYWTIQINSGNLALASIANDLIYAVNNTTGGTAEEILQRAKDLSCLTNKTFSAMAYTELSRTRIPTNQIWPPDNSPWTENEDQIKLDEAAKEWMKGICECIAIPTEELFILSEAIPTVALTSQENLLVKEQESEELINTESNQTSNDECGCNKELETLAIEDGLYSSLGNSYVDNSLEDHSHYGLGPSHNRHGILCLF